MGSRVKSVAKKSTSRKGKSRMEQEEVSDIAYKFGVAFPIFNEEEGKRSTYFITTLCSWTAAKYPSQNVFEKHKVIVTMFVVALIIYRATIWIEEKLKAHQSNYNTIGQLTSYHSTYVDLSFTIGMVTFEPMDLLVYLLSM